MEGHGWHRARTRLAAEQFSKAMESVARNIGQQIQTNSRLSGRTGSRTYCMVIVVVHEDGYMNRW